MGDHGTAIEWTQVPGYKGETWNPVTGCDRVSPGCAHCYALDLAARLKGMGQKRYQRDGDPKTSGPGFGLTLHPDKLDQPVRWSKPRAIFVNSMSDVFHEGIPEAFIGRMFAVMAACPQHIFMVLTKRPDRMHDVIREYGWEWSEEFAHGWGFGGGGKAVRAPAWPLPNVWLGVTIENRRFVDRADVLRDTPAAVRFISAEVLLGPLVFNASVPGPEQPEDAFAKPIDNVWADRADLPQLDLTGIDWLITGGESGTHCRRFDPQWALDLRDRCMAVDPTGRRLYPTAFFHKQNGGRTPKANGRLLDGRTWDEFPTALSPTTGAA